MTSDDFSSSSPFTSHIFTLTERGIGIIKLVIALKYLKSSTILFRKFWTAVDEINIEVTIKQYI